MRCPRLTRREEMTFNHNVTLGLFEKAVVPVVGHSLYSGCPRENALEELRKRKPDEVTPWDREDSTEAPEEG